MNFIRRLTKSFPTFLTAFALAMAVWVSAVTATDPTEERIFPQPIAITVIGLNPDLLVVNEIPEQATVTIRAPESILEHLTNEPGLIKVTLDLSELGPGSHILTPQVSVGVSPTEITRISPSSIPVDLETLETKELPITLNLTGSLPIGYQAEEATLGIEQVLISGPQSIVESISQVIATVDIDNVIEDVQRTIELVPIDSDGVEVTGVSLNPASITVNVPITQLGGYRNVWVTVVTYGQVAQGYRLKYYFAFPPTVTIFSTDPDLVNSLPGYIETTPINLNGASEDFEVNITLNLPEGISIVGDQTIIVQVVIAPIESSLNFTNVPIQVIGLEDNLLAKVSPDVVDVFLSGPLYLLEELNYSDIIVILDLTDHGPGTYQLVPRLELLDEKIKVDAILPGMIEVVITTETSP